MSGLSTSVFWRTQEVQTSSDGPGLVRAFSLELRFDKRERERVLSGHIVDSAVLFLDQKYDRRKIPQACSQNPPLTLQSLVSIEVRRIRIEGCLAAELGQAVLPVGPSSL